MSIKGIGINSDSSRINGDLDLLDRDLAYFKQVGFHYVEIPVHGVDGVVNGELNLKNVERVKEILEKYDLKATVHSPDPLNLRKDDFDLQKKVFQSSIEFTSKLGAKVLVYHGGRFEGTKRENKLENLVSEREIETLRVLSEFAAEREVQICIENGASSVEELLMMVRRVNMENVGITYDFGHAFLYYNYGCHGGEEKFLISIKQSLPYLKHIHIHDNFGRVDVASRNGSYINDLPFGKGDLHMPPGMGRIPYDKVVPLIKDYDGVAMMEIHSRYESLYEEALKRLDEYFGKAHISFGT